jgi:5,10-methylenetetrahydrofolate reductase
MFPPGLPSPGLIKTQQKIDLSVRFEKLVNDVLDLESLADSFSLPELKDGDRIHLNSVSVASELKRRTGSEIIPTITLRDSNQQSLLGSVSYALFSGIENIQIVRGDPFTLESREPKNVYDFARVSDFVSVVRKLESHLANLPRSCLLAPINLSKTGEASYLDMIKKRESSGVDIFVTDSSFEETGKHLERVRKVRDAGVRMPILHNIFPLRDYEDAVSIVKRFGWKIPDEELHGLKLKGAQFGINSARKRYFGLLDRKEISQGACISTRGNPEIVRQIIA